MHGGSVLLDGAKFTAQNAGQPHSALVDGDSVRFELRPGERRPGDGEDVERTELFASPVEVGASCTVSYTLRLGEFENTAEWLVLGQWHGGDNASLRSPFIAVELHGEELAVVVRYHDPSRAKGMSAPVPIYAEPEFPRGEDVSLKISHRPHETDGRCTLWLRGAIVAQYEGPLGYWDETEGPYWKFGIYREAAPETMVATYSDMKVDVGQ